MTPCNSPTQEFGLPTRVSPKTASRRRGGQSGPSEQGSVRKTHLGFIYVPSVRKLVRPRPAGRYTFDEDVCSNRGSDRPAWLDRDRSRPTQDRSLPRVRLCSFRFRQQQPERAVLRLQRRQRRVHLQNQPLAERRRRLRRRTWKQLCRL